MIMGRYSKDHVARYDEVKSETCYFCGGDKSLRPIYHPRDLFPDERGVKIKCCISCYGHYKFKNLENRPLAFVINTLSSRNRYNSQKSNESKIRDRLNLGLTKYFDDSDNLSCVEDDNGVRYDIHDFMLYESSIQVLSTMSQAQIGWWCKENLKDQQLINKIISTINN
jgi:hypothetical protein